VLRLSGFRRIQLVCGLWGLILIVGGILHTNLNSWGSLGLLAIWSGLTIGGLVGSWLIAPEILPSGMLFFWAVVSFLPLLITGLILFPLNQNGAQLIIPLWHLAFAVGYLTTGYFMDRRLWWLAGWEIIVLIFSVLFNYRMIELGEVRISIGITFGLTSGIPLLIAALPVWGEQYGTYKQGTRNRASSS
jgi:hypothetical protein